MGGTKEPDQLAEFLEGPNRGSPEAYINGLRDALDRSQRQVTRLQNRIDRHKTEPQTHLVIGDAHACPDEPNDRFTWLGRLAAELRPDVIIDIGDWADMQTLYRYETTKGQAPYEGSRVISDIRCAVEARRLFHEELPDDYQPRLIHTVGNHEFRIEKALEQDPRMSGMFSLSDLRAEEFGWEVYPYTEPVVVGGIAYSHFFTWTAMGKPTGGKYIAANMLANKLMSCVAGHHHVYQYQEAPRADGQMQMGVVVGCYFEQDMVYAGPQGNDRWWRGLVIIRDVIDGYGHVEKIPMEEVKRRYGG